MIRALIALSGGAGRRQLLTAVALGVLSGVTQGIVVLCVIPVLADIARADWQGAMHAALFMAVFLVLHAAVTIVATFAGFTASLGVIRSMHRGLGERLVRLPLSWFGPQTQGRASHVVVRGTLFVATAAMDVLVPLLVGVAMPATVAVGTLLVDWRMGVALVAAAPVVWLTSRLAARWESAGEDRVRGVRAETDLRLLELSRNQEVLRSAGMAGDYPPLRRAVEAQRAAGRRALWLSLGGMVIQGFVIQTVLGIAVALSVWSALDGADPVTAVALIGLVTLAAGPLRVVSSMQTALHQSEAEINDVREVLETAPLPEPTDPVPYPRHSEVVMDDVTFSYGKEEVLKGLSARFAARSCTAVIGPSGSGKTTIVRLLARLWDVTGGSVRIGGVDLRDMASEDLHAHISMIFQDVYLFDDTLRANVMLGREDATEAELLEAAERARVTEIVERLPEGWDTRVGEGGRLLSGGERQRVSVARALLRRAPLVLCDEPSSALDSSTRRAVTSALEDLARDATVVVVAHQLETIRRADRILLVEHGRIAAEGTHEELSASDERYRRFWSLREEAGRWNLAADR
ncbi:ABC transporter ATP-binding protein [Corynebacterium mastitidis]|uniref:ABC transporter ATP-binding protein n=1 Tax=Corynebacterium mastitidis TaxID=161890 RepID=UPI0003611F70|nr:ABC transporter ATP-binding protein [Corynebacterium mastitidis]